MPEPARYIVSDNFCFEVSTRELFRIENDDSTKLLPLGSRAADMLLLFLQRPGQLVTKKEITDAVWPNTAVDDSNLPVQILAVRRALATGRNGASAILTVPGRGYRFTLPVRCEEVSEGNLPVAPSVGPIVIIDQGVREATSRLPAVATLAPVTGSDTGLSANPIAVNAPSWRPLRARHLLWVGSAAFAIVVAVLWIFRLGNQDTGMPVYGAFDASVVPLITDAARHELATYPTQPDFKALAISSSGYGLAFNARDASSAKAEALERCKAKVSGGRYCALYAVGTDVVWSMKSLRLPLPADIHDKPLEDERFNAADLSLSRPGRSDETAQNYPIVQNYTKNPDHRALALVPTTDGIGRFYNSFNLSTPRDAARLTVEGCADLNQAPCLLISVDGFWTIRVPKEHRVVGWFMLTNDPALSDEDRQRIAAVYGLADWRAMARGKSGRLYPVAGAPTEAAAVEQALRGCAADDADCQIYAISNFRVAPDP
jgi:DNA-binding winged helix-turn-helix (wHTH) protein